MDNKIEKLTFHAPDLSTRQEIPVAGEFTVKRVRLEKGCAWLMPSNPKYQPIRVDAANDFQIWGIVRHVIKTFK